MIPPGKLKINGNGVDISGPGLDALKQALERLTQEQVLVGIPAEKTDRPSEPTPITNATLGYIHEFGAPEGNIPARPWLMPPIRDHRKELGDALGRAAKSNLDPTQKYDFDERMHQVGLRAVNYIKAYIRSGIQPPLAEYTLQQRAARGRKGAQQELDNRAAGLPPSVLLAKPLIDTGALFAAISYVVDIKGTP